MEENPVVNENDSPITGEKPKIPTGWMILSFLVPVAGLIIFIIWRKKYTQKAKCSGFAAIAGAVVSVLILVSFLIGASVVPPEIQTKTLQKDGLSMVNFTVPQEWEKEKSEDQENTYYYREYEGEKLLNFMMVYYEPDMGVIDDNAYDGFIEGLNKSDDISEMQQSQTSVAGIEGVKLNYIEKFDNGTFNIETIVFGVGDTLFAFAFTFSSEEDDGQAAFNKVIQSISLDEGYAALVDEVKKLNIEKNSLDTDIDTLDSEITSLEEDKKKLSGDVAKAKSKPKSFSAGEYTAGEDFDEGRYKIYDGSSNFVVYDLLGGLQVNIILGGRYGEESYIYEFEYGDKIKASSSFKLQPLDN